MSACATTLLASGSTGLLTFRILSSSFHVPRALQLLQRTILTRATVSVSMPTPPIERTHFSLTSASFRDRFVEEHFWWYRPLSAERIPS